jgi:hypothetical protein
MSGEARELGKRLERPTESESYVDGLEESPVAIRQPLKREQGLFKCRRCLPIC